MFRISNLNFKTRLVHLLVLFVTCYSAQEYYEEKYKHFLRTHKGPLHTMPKKFEISGQNAKTDLKKYITHITDMANKENLTVLYKVKVEFSKPTKKRKLTKSMHKKTKSKKYNVPLKKNSMRLSNFEKSLRRLAEDNGQDTKNEENSPVTSEKQLQKFTTKIPFIGKYKPLLNRVKTVYPKRVKPVKNNIITLTK